MEQQDTTTEEIILCPSCDEPAKRIKRTGLMRLFPFSRHIYCNGCHERYFKLFGAYIKLDRINIF